ncbi:hypothetical protein BDW60DRAFT_179901 [Aspergillus nidulans var. acristatus]
MIEQCHFVIILIIFHYYSWLIHWVLFMPFDSSHSTASNRYPLLFAVRRSSRN